MKLPQFGNVTVDIVVIIAQTDFKCSKKIELSGQGLLLYQKIPSKIQNDSDDTSDDNDSYLYTNIGCNNEQALRCYEAQNKRNSHIRTKTSMLS
jgi:hypothetical protein